MDLATTVAFHDSCDLDGAITDWFLSLTGLLDGFLQVCSKKTRAVDGSSLAIHKTANNGIRVSCVEGFPRLLLFFVIGRTQEIVLC